MKSIIMLSVTAFFMTGCNPSNQGSAVVSLSGSGIAIESEGSGDFSMEIPGLFLEDVKVPQGAYSGLRLLYRTRERDGAFHELSLFIPAHDRYRIEYLSRKGEYLMETPELPFSFRYDDTVGVIDSRGRLRPMDISISRWRRSGDGDWSQDVISFRNCEIEVSRMLIENARLTFAGKFNCNSEGSNASSYGEFSVESVGLGVSKV